MGIRYGNEDTDKGRGNGNSCLWAFGKVNLKVGMGSVEMGSGREWERGSGYQELE